jgi:RNA polymerase sigma-70 factor (ECF subfamily)
VSGIDPAVEEAVQQACQSGELDLAATRALEAYGPEILSFLSARLRSGSDGEEAFSIFAEDLWKGLPGFGFRCSVRGYMYTLARNAANRWASAPQNRVDRNLSVSAQASLSALRDRSRSATHMYRRTEVKDKVRALREQLPEEDQAILILHVDRGLPWREIAMVMSEEGEAVADDVLDRESARLRKRFERVKVELKALAQKAGLIKPE